MTGSPVGQEVATRSGEPRVHRCRLCGAEVRHTFVDLGAQPFCESYLTAAQLDDVEPFYPLHARVCGRCFLVQVPQYVAPADLFTEYAYFSSYSSSWLRHAEGFVDAVLDRYELGPANFVVELASNDGYLLQYMLGRGPRVLGVEPAANVAQAAIDKGIPTVIDFFGSAFAERLRDRLGAADLVIANNVLAQVPDLNDFVAGIAVLLGSDGVVTVEVPHVLHLIGENQFDTIYHEHFSYFSLHTLGWVANAHGLEIFDVEQLPTHGGSLRAHLCHLGMRQSTPQVATVLADERAAGLDRLSTYASFADQVESTKRSLLRFLITAKDQGSRVAGYGAPGKGNTLLNYCGIRADLLAYTVDRNPYKQGLYTPGTRIPIHPTSRLAETRPDYVLIMPWNLREEIAADLAYTAEWGAKLVVAIPATEVFDPGAGS